MAKAVEKIKVAIEEHKDSIDLSSLNLQEVPIELKAALHLKRINLSFNKIEVLPDWFSEFVNLENLDFRGNNLSRLIPDMRKLGNLTTLNLRNNLFQEIPIEMRELNKLFFVSFSSNQISVVPEWFFKIPNVNIEDNPIIDPPIEIYSRGHEAIANYFKEREKGTENLYEAKLLIVGEAGAGKTSLMNKILDENYILNPFEVSTKGIEIKPYYFHTTDKNYFRINIWDFGGQEIYHATHQFFLTKRSLYILLADNRAENTDFNYWLQTIELLSGNSPLLIVQNEKHDRKKDINAEGMRERFKNIKGSYSFNLNSDKSNLRALVRGIQYTISELPHIGTELPKIWVDIRKELEQISAKRSYITESEYLEICTSHGMVERERASFLSDYLHDLGVFLHFRDNAVLKRWIILRPDWGTEAVYRILDDEKVISSNGYFNKEDLRQIWQSSLYVDMHDELISLMMKFELCYKLEDQDTYIAPQLLQTTKSRYQWLDTGNLSAKYDYDFMPKGIITRFIVRMHFYISDQKMVWREGVILVREETRAEIIETYGKKEIRIRVQGRNQREFLAIILDSLDKIHLTYSNLKVKKLIPCNCSVCSKSITPYYFSYDELRRYLINGIMEERCKNSLKMMKIENLLADALGKNIEINALTTVYISNVSEDDNLKSEFLKYLKPITNTKKYKVYENSDVKPGENEKSYVRDKIDTCDVIILLVTQNYLVDDWTFSNQLTRAMDRSEVGSCLTIPVILKDCNWSETPLSKLKPVLFNKSPLLSSTNALESAFVDASLQIKTAIQSFLEKKQLEIGEKLIHDND